jgi:hypothetical protein
MVDLNIRINILAIETSSTIDYRPNVPLPVPETAILSIACA